MPLSTRPGRASMSFSQRSVRSRPNSMISPRNSTRFSNCCAIQVRRRCIDGGINAADERTGDDAPRQRLRIFYLDTLNTGGQMLRLYFFDIGKHIDTLVDTGFAL